MDLVIGFLESAIRVTTPILLAALGAMFTARAGIINFSMEGIMIMGAFFGVYGSNLTGSAWIGALMGMIAGMLVSLVLAFMSITAKVDQVVAGTGINILFLGLSSYLLNIIYGTGSRPSQVVSFEPVAIPILSEIPVIGPLFFNQLALVYIAFLLVPVCWYVVKKTPYGLALQAVGEHPHAADSLGISVVKVRYGATLLSGLLGGLGGAFLSIGQLSVFMEKMTAGRGYMAWSAVTVGSWNPLGIMGSSLLFGAAEAVQLRLQAVGIEIPHQFFLMLPYVLTMLVLCGLVGRRMGPKAMGKPYTKGER